MRPYLVKIGFAGGKSQIPGSKPRATPKSQTFKDPREIVLSEFGFWMIGIWNLTSLVGAINLNCPRMPIGLDRFDEPPTG